MDLQDKKKYPAFGRKSRLAKKEYNFVATVPAFRLFVVKSKQ